MTHDYGSEIACLGSMDGPFEQKKVVCFSNPLKKTNYASLSLGLIPGFLFVPPVGFLFSYLWLYILRTGQLLYALDFFFNVLFCITSFSVYPHTPSEII